MVKTQGGPSSHFSLADIAMSLFPLSPSPIKLRDFCSPHFIFFFTAGTGKCGDYFPPYVHVHSIHVHVNIHALGEINLPAVRQKGLMSLPRLIHIFNLTRIGSVMTVRQ